MITTLSESLAAQIFLGSHVKINFLLPFIYNVSTEIKYFSNMTGKLGILDKECTLLIEKLVKDPKLK